MPIPTLLTPHTRLRPFTPADAPVLHTILNEPGILQYYPNPNPPPLERMYTFIERQLTGWQERGYAWWAVCTFQTDEIIGWNGLQYLPETGETEVGYLYSHAHWGKGYATEGAKAALEWGFQEFPLQQIIGLTHPENIASQRVLLKCGLQFDSRAQYFGMDCFRYTINRPA